MLSGRPKPAAAQKKMVVVQFRAPITYDPADAQAAEEEVRTGGRCRVLGRWPSLLWLPCRCP